MPFEDVAKVALLKGSCTIANRIVWGNETVSAEICFYYRTDIAAGSRSHKNATAPTKMLLLPQKNYCSHRKITALTEK